MSNKEEMGMEKCSNIASMDMEAWIHVRDMTERKRIQNKHAQRRYRENLRRRKSMKVAGQPATSKPTKHRPKTSPYGEFTIKSSITPTTSPVRQPIESELTHMILPEQEFLHLPEPYSRYCHVLFRRKRPEQIPVVENGAPKSSRSEGNPLGARSSAQSRQNRDKTRARGRNEGTKKVSTLEMNVDERQDSPGYASQQDQPGMVSSYISWDQSACKNTFGLCSISSNAGRSAWPISDDFATPTNKAASHPSLNDLVITEDVVPGSSPSQLLSWNYLAAQNSPSLGWDMRSATSNNSTSPRSSLPSHDYIPSPYDHTSLMEALCLPNAYTIVEGTGTSHQLYRYLSMQEWGGTYGGQPFLAI